MKKVVAIVLSISILVSLIGLNLFSHICNHTHTVATAIIPTYSNCISDEHSCCHSDESHHESSACCDTNEIPEIPSNQHNLHIKSESCCIDVHKYFALESSTILNLSLQTQLVNNLNLFKIDFDIPIVPILSHYSLFIIDDFLDITSSYHTELIEYIYHSSSIS